MTPKLRPVTAVVVVVALLVAGVVLWRGLRDDRSRVDVGAGVTMRDGSRVSGYPTELLLPFGSYRLTVGDPREELPSPCCTDEPADQRAPQGGSFVGVAVAQLTQRSLLEIPVVEPGATLRSPTFTLLVQPMVDGPVEEYPLTTIDEDWDPTALLNRELAVYVAVAGRPEIGDVSVRVSYDGVDQTVSPDRGDVDSQGASGLKQSDVRALVADCGEIGLPRGFSTDRDFLPTCSQTRQRLAYVAGVGWAPDGTTWWVVTTGVDPYVAVDRVVGGRRFGYRFDLTLPTTGRAQLSLGGQPPVASWTTGRDGLMSVFEEVDRTSDLALKTSVTYTDLDANDDPRPVDEVTLTWSSPF